MTDPGFDHGPRLSDAEYERRIVALHAGRAPLPTPDEDRALRRAELDLAIDHRLGAAFPPERREALWAVRERIERQRLKLGLAWAARKLMPRALARGATGLVDAMAAAYAEVLSPAELQSFLGLQPGQRPGLPIDEDQLRRR